MHLSPKLKTRAHKLEHESEASCERRHRTPSNDRANSKAPGTVAGAAGANRPCRQRTRTRHRDMSAAGEHDTEEGGRTLHGGEITTYVTHPGTRAGAPERPVVDVLEYHRETARTHISTITDRCPRLASRARPRPLQEACGPRTAPPPFSLQTPAPPRPAIASPIQSGSGAPGASDAVHSNRTRTRDRDRCDPAGGGAHRPPASATAPPRVRVRVRGRVASSDSAGRPPAHGSSSLRAPAADGG